MRRAEQAVVVGVHLLVQRLAERPRGGMPLWHCAALNRHAMAETLLTRGADPNGRVYASGSPVFRAYMAGDRPMIELLQRYGGVADAITVAMHGETALATKMLAGELDGRPEDGMLWRPFPGRAMRPDFARYLECLRLMIARGDANARGSFGRALLHDIAVRGMPDEQVAYAALLLDAGARLDVRDELLKSTPLGWACRWGRVELVGLLLERGADPIEPGAEPWASPRAWAEKRGHAAIAELLLLHQRS